MAIDLAKAGVAAVAASASSSTARSAEAAASNRAASATQQSHRAVQAAAQQLESHLLGMGRSVEFSVDTQTNISVVTVKDKISGEVIRQMPSEEALWLAQHLDAASSFLLNTSA